MFKLLDRSSRISHAAAVWKVYAAGIAEHFGSTIEDAEVEVLQQALRKILAALA